MRGKLRASRISSMNSSDSFSIPFVALTIGTPRGNVFAGGELGDLARAVARADEHHHRGALASCFFHVSAWRFQRFCEGNRADGKYFSFLPRLALICLRRDQDACTIRRVSAPFLRASDARERGSPRTATQHSRYLARRVSSVRHERRAYDSNRGIVPSSGSTVRRHRPSCALPSSAPAARVARRVGQDAVCSDAWDDQQSREQDDAPADASRRASIEFCTQMVSHDAPLKLAPESPVIGRFFPIDCHSKDIGKRGPLRRVFGGFGYGYTNISKRMSFSRCPARSSTTKISWSRQMPVRHLCVLSHQERRILELRDQTDRATDLASFLNHAVAHRAEFWAAVGFGGKLTRGLHRDPRPRQQRRLRSRDHRAWQAARCTLMTFTETIGSPWKTYAPKCIRTSATSLAQ